MRRLTYIYLLIPALAVTLFGVNIASPEAGSDEETIYDVMLEEDELQVFSELVTESEMHRHLHHEGPYTVLAPKDEAIDNLPAEEVGELMQDNQMQRELMDNHIFQGEHAADDVEHVVEDGEVVDEIYADNGVVLVINSVVEEVEN